MVYILWGMFWLKFISKENANILQSIDCFIIVLFKCLLDRSIMLLSHYNNKSTLKKIIIKVLLSFNSFIIKYYYIYTPEKAMAPHSSTLAWNIPWMEEPGRLQSMGSLGVGHDWATSLSLFTFIHWRRKWQPTPVFLPGESQGRGSLVGCHLWGHTESDTTEAT